jgi:hypothetical protein
MIYVAVLNSMMVLRLMLARARNLRQLSYYPMALGLFVFVAFRFEVGCDWSGYLHQYVVYGRTVTDDLLTTREALWVGLFQIQHWLGLPYPWINVFAAVIFFGGAHVMARRQPDPLAFLIFLLPVLIVNMPMSGIRQGAAIGVMCMAFVAFNDRALVRFLVFTAIASGLHSSAAIFFLLAPLVGGNYSRNRLILAIVLAIPGAYFLTTGESAEVASSRYLETDVEAAGGAFRVGFLALSAAYFLLFVKRKWRHAFPGDFKLVMIGSLLMIAMVVLLPLSSVIADRVAYYLIPIQAVIFARLPYLRWQKLRTAHVVMPYVAVLALFVVWTTRSWLFDVCYLPYQSWLFDLRDML